MRPFPNRIARAAVPLNERFMDYVSPEPNTGCWLWIGGIASNGYPRFNTKGSRPAMQQAHRFAYELLKGPIPEGLHLDHLCKQVCCVNPDHLEPVTQKENNRRQRHRTLGEFCGKGHPMSGENLVTYISKGRLRYNCRSCVNAASKAWYHRGKKAI